MLLFAVLNLEVGSFAFGNNRRPNATYHAPALSYQPHQSFNNTRYPAGGYQPQPSYGFNQHVQPKPSYGYNSGYGAGYYNNSRPYRPNNSTGIFAKLFRFG